MIHRVAVPLRAIVVAITIVMWHSYSSRGILAVMAGHKKTIAMVPKATLQFAAIFLVVSSDLICSSAGLHLIVQLENENRRKH